MKNPDRDYADNPDGDYRFWRLDYASYPEKGDQPGNYERKAPVLDFGTARDEDRARYYEPRVLDREIDRIWRKSWVLAGHLNDIPKPNNFMKVDLGRDSILVVRNEDGTVRAMHNVCQHRGTILVTHDFGSTKRFVCPFHGWQWNNDGSLRLVKKPETYQKSSLCYDLDLPAVRVEQWKGWIFINLDQDAGPLDSFLPKAWRDVHDAYDFERMVRVVDVTQEWHVNWKTAMEAFLEGHHLEVLHPQMNSYFNAYDTQIDLYDNGFARVIFPNMQPCPTKASYRQDELPMECRVFLGEAGFTDEQMPTRIEDVRPALIEGKRRNQKRIGMDYSRFSDEQLVDAWNSSVFPSCTWSIHPEGILVQRWWPHPHDPRKCQYYYQGYVCPGIKEVPSYMGVPAGTDTSGETVLRRTYAENGNLEILGEVLAQDATFIPRVQRGIESLGFRGQVLSDQEVRIRQFYTVYYRLMHGDAAGRLGDANDRLDAAAE
jgi:phenylpropionate dioxygenase-like ring-hydroxylating dioxygenase large terminal subunit